MVEQPLPQLKTCGTCGYLGYKSTTETTWYECEEEFRKAGTRSRHNIANRHGDPMEMRCFCKRLNIAAMVTTRVQNGASEEDGVRAVIAEDRSWCNNWTPYDHGFNPREHLEANRMLYTEEIKRAIETSRAASDAKFNRLSIILVIVGLALAAAQVVVAVMSVK